MHFTAEQASEVKAWMVKRLEDISDADPEILTEYCWAILQSDATNDEIKKSAVENLEDFLKQHTVGFVDEIFVRYATSAQLPTTTALTKSGLANIGEESQHHLPIQPYESAESSSQRPPEKLNNGRKRSYNDENSYGQDMHYSSSTASKPSRSRRANGDGRNSGRMVSSQRLPSSRNNPAYSFGNAPFPPTPSNGFPPFDANNPMTTYAFMQKMLPQMASMLPPLPPPPSTSNGELQSSQYTPQCLDYSTKGFCVLGSSCPYGHGQDPIVAPRVDEYDPTRANLSMNGATRGAPKGTGSQQGTRRRQGSPRSFNVKRNNRALFSDTRLPPDPNFTTIVVEQIPEQYFEEETVRNFFSQYGQVLEVTMKAYKRLAIVKYDTQGAAKRAWESPKAVFENRFVKVYWYRPDLETEEVVKGNGSSPQASNVIVNGAAVDGEDFKQQQDEKQKMHEEKKRRRKAMEDARQDLVSRWEKMTKEHEALVRKVAIAEGRETEPQNTSLAEDVHPGSDSDDPNPKVKALREQLAKMQAEAKSLGIDPDVSPNDPLPTFSAQNRGLGKLVRGDLAARGSQRRHVSQWGRHQGYGFVRGRDPSVRKLDNRPKDIAISGVDFDNAKEENLRSHLTLIGPFEDIELNPQRKDSRIIRFKERWMAEKVMHRTPDIPGVGKVELCWVANAVNEMPQASSSLDDVVSGDAGEEGRQTFSDEPQQPQDDNLDVAGGDDDDWGDVA